MYGQLIDANLIRMLLTQLSLTDVVAHELLLLLNLFYVVFPVDLLGLLNWRSNPGDLDQILQRLMEVEGGEIVKVSSHCVTNTALSADAFRHALNSGNLLKFSGGAVCKNTNV